MVTFRLPWFSAVQADLDHPMPGDAQRLNAMLEHLVAQGAGVSSIADAAVAVWRGVEGALSPIIGPSGVAALYRRSLHLTRGTHACLAEVYDADREAGGFVPLHRTLSQQTPAVAVAANGVLLQTFCDLLASLIGATLTERLLRSVQDTHSGGDAALDTTP